jgi:2-polyprenyl-3-methyl-5-hydroxy-6-metoxy-1,4-benzoquinol methylase
MTSPPQCWCGNEDLSAYSPDYLRCPACETLVLTRMPDPDTLRVADDQTDFYGRQYYESYLIDHYKYPSLVDRARFDLPERCLFWLKAALRFKLPPGRALELGCAHGGFVALLRWAGFDASGLELSHWLAEFARNAFSIPMLEGSVEDQRLEPGSLDLIAAMDVLEHLSDPVYTMRHCMNLLNPDGAFLIQTPQYPEGMSYEQLVARNDAFLAQFKPEQHLYLFSRTSLKRLFQQIGAPYVQFLPAIFGHYDMFALATRRSLPAHTNKEISDALLRSPNGRLVGALLDLDHDRMGLTGRLQTSEADRAARLEVIERQGDELGAVAAERNTLRAELEQLRTQLQTSEADRAARLEVIERRESELALLATERNGLLSKVQNLQCRVTDVENTSTALRVAISRMQQSFAYRALCAVGLCEPPKTETPDSPLRPRIQP